MHPNFLTPERKKNIIFWKNWLGKKIQKNVIVNNDDDDHNNNYVDGQICYHFYRKLAELLPKIWQFCYLGRFATMIGRFATRLGRFATGLGRFATFWLSLADLLPNEINHVTAIVFTNLWCAICWGGKMHTSNLVEILVVSYSQLRLFCLSL